MKFININNLESPELQIYSGLSEPQLYHYYEPEPGLFIAESPMIIERAIYAGYEPVSALVDADNINKDVEKVLGHLKEEVPVYAAPLAVLKGITGFNLTRGILCAMRRREDDRAFDIIRNADRIVVLENVMNPTNIGAIIRSAAALGMDGVILTRGCADPFYRRAARVSVGTAFQIPWAYVENCSEAFDLLRQNNFKIAAMALREDNINLYDLKPDAGDRIAMVMGTEGEGLSDETLKSCDMVVKIPMANGVDSLNVAAASAVAFYQIQKR